MPKNGIRIEWNEGALKKVERDAARDIRAGSIRIACPSCESQMTVSGGEGRCPNCGQLVVV